MFLLQYCVRRDDNDHCRGRRPIVEWDGRKGRKQHGNRIDVCTQTTRTGRDRHLPHTHDPQCRRTLKWG